MQTDLTALKDVMETAALAAARAIMAVHSTGPEVQVKPDSSPVTKTD